jgi:hypothetical protein
VELVVLAVLAGLQAGLLVLMVLVVLRPEAIRLALVMALVVAIAAGMAVAKMA